MNKFQKGIGLSALLLIVAAAQFACDGDNKNSNSPTPSEKRGVVYELQNVDNIGILHIYNKVESKLVEVNGQPLPAIGKPLALQVTDSAVYVLASRVADAAKATPAEPKNTDIAVVGNSVITAYGVNAGGKVVGKPSTIPAQDATDFAVTNGQLYLLGQGDAGKARLCVSKLVDQKTIGDPVCQDFATYDPTNKLTVAGDIAYVNAIGNGTSAVYAIQQGVDGKLAPATLVKNSGRLVALQPAAGTGSIYAISNSSGIVAFNAVDPKDGVYTVYPTQGPLANTYARIAFAPNFAYVIENSKDNNNTIDAFTFNPNAKGSDPQFTPVAQGNANNLPLAGVKLLAIDATSDFVYAAADAGIFGYNIESSGALSKVADTPLAADKDIVALTFTPAK